MDALLFIISGPSGVGKGTVVQGVIERRPDKRVSVSCTTRPARPMERDGHNYYFISEREFEARRERGEFLEWAEVHGNLYGTPRSTVEEQMARGFDVILEIDVQGAVQVKAKVPESVLIFLEPPDMLVLEQRLRGRRTERADERERRMLDAHDELRRKGAFDAVIVNDHLDRTVEEVLQRMDELKRRSE